MNFRKKSQTSNVVTLIIFIVVIIILFPAFNIIYGKIVNTSTDEICRASILKHAGVNSKTMNMVTTSIDCPRNNLLFEDDKVTLDDETLFVYEKETDKKKTREINKLNSYVVNQVLAKELYKCWNKMGEGKLKLFDEGWTFDEHACLICDQFRFNIDSTQTFTGLNEYLKTYLIPNDPNGLTYDSYFNKKFNPKYTGSGSSPYIQKIIEFNPNKEYVIVFYGIKTGFIAKNPDSYYLEITDIKGMNDKCKLIN